MTTKPGDHRTVQARILAYAQEIGWRHVPLGVHPVLACGAGWPLAARIGCVLQTGRSAGRDASRVKLAPSAEIPASLRHADAPPPGMVVLAAAGVSKHFDDFVAVDRLSIEVTHGQLHALIGPNGAGKRTLFNLLSGTHPADDVSLTYCGEPIDARTPDAFARLGIARSFQITNCSRR